MSGHTPGPWFVRHCDDERYMCMTVISTKDRGPCNDSQFDGESDTVAITYHQCVPFVSGGFEIDDSDERDANARLIAAAPELLSALCALGVIGNGYCFCSEERDPAKGDHQPECIDARLAIAKATGEQA